RIVKVLAKEAGRTLGVFRRGPDGIALVSPVDKKSLGRRWRVPPDLEGGAADGDLVAIETARGGGGGPDVARVVERLGAVGTERALSTIAIKSLGLRDEFPAAVLREAADLRPAPAGDREDWRDLPLVTIDPPDAKDHDDAVHARADADPGNPGGHVLTVAIADVAAYVRAGSALDSEALARGNSIYFPDRVVPMLPERLSNDLCSLREDEDRPAIAVRIVVDARGVKRSHSFHRVVMRSAAKLAYEQAQSAIDGRPDATTAPLLEPALRPLWAAYGAARLARDGRSPLDLDLPERKLKLDAQGRLVGVTVPLRLDAHRLIEEFMIQANVAAAETLEAARVELLYRAHDAPTPEKVKALSEFLTTLGVKFGRDREPRAATFNRLLAETRGTPYEALVNESVLRSQAQAEYSAENYGHFGLNLRRYAHFTSPIRRYADLVVHRGLIRACKLGPGGLTDAEAAALPKVAEAISSAERRAMAAERDTADRLVAHFLADRIGAQFAGVVAGATRAGLFVKLDELGADGFVPASSLGGDRWRFDEAHRALVAARGRERHRVGDRVEVRLVEAAPFAGALRFELLANLGHAPGATAGRAPRRGQAAAKGAKARARNKGKRSRT
ncbi:MAG: VacB/RNase II family 3'-5' exoribonuclease, partial [Hyphomicrobiales bacterium]|nr:VacB/RNase II family 3'-5' exoribonuclease [Hyphomicrobiales bacterium]